MQYKRFVSRHPLFVAACFLAVLGALVVFIFNTDVQKALLGEQPHLDVGKTYHVVGFSDSSTVPGGVVVIEWKPGKTSSWGVPLEGVTIHRSDEVEPTDCTLTLLAYDVASFAVPSEGIKACR